MTESRAVKNDRRRSQFRRLRRQNRGVSPVVATLILILVAVAAAAALYLWLVVWQKGVTNTIGTPTAHPTITIGGSTTVFPLTELATKWFEENNSAVVVSDQQGGSTAGILSLCQSQGVDIAASSSYQLPATLAADGCPTNIVQTTVGLDSVVPIAASNNVAVGQLSNLVWPVHYFAPTQTASSAGDKLNFADTTTAGSYASGDTITVTPNVAFAGAGPATMTFSPAGAGGTCTASIATATLNAGCTYILPAVSSGQVVTISATDAGAGATQGTPISAVQTAIATSSATGSVTFSVGSEQVFSFNATTLDAIYLAGSTGGAPTGPAASFVFPAWLSGSVGTPLTWHAIPFPAGCIYAGTAGFPQSGIGVPCGFAASATPIKTYDRLDNSGTEDGFATKLLGWTCGTDHQLESCNVIATHAVGNPGVLSAVAADKNGLGFVSHGFAAAPSSGVTMAAFLGTAKTLQGTSLGAQTLAILPSPTTTKNGYFATSSTTPNSVYAGWRVLEYLTIGTPTGEAGAYINFVLGPQVNQDLCAAAGYISLDSS